MRRCWKMPTQTRAALQAILGAVILAALIAPAMAPVAAATAATRRLHPAAPKGLRVVKKSANVVVLRWNSSLGATTYRLLRNGGIRAKGVRSTGFRDGRVSRFTAYSYAVKACNHSGCSLQSATKTIVTPGGSCSGVHLRATSNVQRAINARRAGTTFCLASGTYHIRSPIIPKSYDVLRGARRTVLTGDGRTSRALVGYGRFQHHVKVRGLAVMHFRGPDGAISMGNNWFVEGNRIGPNGDIGVRAQRGGTVRGNYIHHNGVYGLAGALHLSRVEFSHNVVAFNHRKPGSGGGGKILKASRVKFLGNYVHNNRGHGLQCDTDCIHLVFAGNHVIGNRGIGIFYERGFAAVIRNNVVSGNDGEAAGRSVHWGSQIHLNDSQDVEVYGNRVSASVKGTNGIGLVDVARGRGPHGTYRIANDYIHGNFIAMRGVGMTGLVGNAHRPGIRHNRFRHNRYRVPLVGGKHFAWVKYPLTWRSWRARGQDRAGSILPL
jgi:hypothetical protein